MRNKILLAVLIGVGVFLQFKFLGNLKINTKVISDTITFFSIAFGFYVTSLSIFATSRYITRLHKVQDPEYPSLTLLNHLINNYKFGLIFVLATICYLLLIQSYLAQSDAVSISMNNVLALPIGSVFIANVVCFYIMLHHLIRVIIKEAEL